MATAKYQISDFTVDDAATYKAKLDGNSKIGERIAAAYQCYEASTPNMTVKVAAGNRLVDGAMLENAIQTSGTITAPSVNPRIDRVVVDAITGVASIVTGVEAGSPVAPAVPAGKEAVAYFQLATSTTAITNSMIVDERPQRIVDDAGADLYLHSAAPFLGVL